MRSFFWGLIWELGDWQAIHKIKRLIDKAGKDNFIFIAKSFVAFKIRSFPFFKRQGELYLELANTQINFSTRLSP